MSFEILYNPHIVEYKDFERGDLTASFDMFRVNTIAPGNLKLAGFIAQNGISEGTSGDLAHLTFKVMGRQENECYPLRLKSLKDHIRHLSKIIT